MGLPFAILFILCHLVDRDHVAVRHEHESLVVEDLAVDFEVFRDTFVQYNVPRGRSLTLLHRVEADPISPKMLHHANLQLELVNRDTTFDFVRIQYELEIKLLVIRLNIYALCRLVVVVVDEHEV